MEKITWDEGLEMIETKEEEANKLIQQFANTINDKEQQYSVKKFKGMFLFVFLYDYFHLSLTDTNLFVALSDSRLFKHHDKVI